MLYFTKVRQMTEEGNEGDKKVTCILNVTNVISLRSSRI